MSYTKQRADFLTSPEADIFKQALVEMTKSTRYNTCSSYTKITPEHPDGKISFTEKHLEYIAEHPSTNPKLYLANLKLKTRII